MKKFEGILFCTDLDGTLLRANHTVSPENTDAIEYFKSEGGLFTFMTARVPCISRRLYEIVRPNAPIGCVNGGGLYDFEAGSYVWTHPLSPSVVELVNYVADRMESIGIQINTFDKIYFCRENVTMQRFRLFKGAPILNASPDEIREPMAKVLFGSPEGEDIEALEALLRAYPLSSEFECVRSEYTFFDVLPKGVSKGTGLLRLAEHLGMDPARTIAAGDYYNDVPMLRAAGLGVAVGNACEDAKQAADLVTVSNEEHAIAAIIEALDQGKIVLK